MGVHISKIPKTSYQKIKVLFVLNSLKRRGAEQQLFNFVNALPSDSLDLSIFSFSSNPKDFPEFFTGNKVRVWLNPYQGTYNLFRILPLIACMHRLRPDVVVTLGLGAALLLGRVAAVLFGTKVIYSQLNTFENFNNLPRKDGRYFDVLNSWLNKLLPGFPGFRACRFLANSNLLSARVARESRAYPVYTLYNGLPLEEIDHLMADDGVSDRLRPIAKSIQGHPVLAQVGELDENKNVGFTIKCLEQIRQKIPRIRLLVIGDGPVRESLEKNVLSRNLGENVVFTGQMNRVDCVGLMRMADVVVLTSHSESFPNVLVEGQALGLAAVSFDVGAANEIVSDGKTGYIVTPEDSKEFIEKVVRLFSSESHCKTMGQKGQKRVFELFGMGKKVASFLEWIHEDLKMHPLAIHIPPN